MSRRGQAIAAAGAMLAWAAGCIGWQQFHDWRLTARIAAEGFTPWPGGIGGADHLYWLHQPGHLLRIVGTIGDRLPIAAVLAALTAFLVWMAWTMRYTAALYVFAALSCGLSVLFTGAFFSRTGYPTDFAVELAGGDYRNHGRAVVAVCAVESIGIREVNGARGGAYFTLTGRKRDGGIVDLVTFDAPAPAYALQNQVAADVAGLACPASP